MSVIAGIDYSMTSPSICIYDTNTEFKFENIKLYNFNTVKKRVGVYGEHNNITISLQPEYETQEERFNNIRNWAYGILCLYGVGEVVLEGYAMGSSKGLVFQIAENTSLLKQAMRELKIKFETPAPTSIKKNFTGSGKADKPMMIDQFHKEFPEIKFHELIGVKEYGKPIDDIVDAYAMMKMHSHFKETK